ncbi:hypothetical protein G6F35_017580 [Rhizopus arrhizus]|nr:hypothetical protein G6F35_017580 [Rhizopus arrhizus]KAG1385489.1 hypothetical protein G6F59_017374 [Rhizopus arrhizus]
MQRLFHGLAVQQPLTLERIHLALGRQLGGRKPQRQRVAEAHAHRHRLAGLDALALEYLLKQAHRLEELEAVWFGQQLLGYARIDSPLRAGHRTISSPLSPDTSTSRVKLLACT